MSLKSECPFIRYRICRHDFVKTGVNLFLECQKTFGVQTNNLKRQILRLLTIFSTPNQGNNRKMLHFRFINRKRRNFTVIIRGIVRLLVV